MAHCGRAQPEARFCKRTFRDTQLCPSLTCPWEGAWQEGAHPGRRQWRGLSPLRSFCLQPLPPSVGGLGEGALYTHLAPKGQPDATGSLEEERPLLLQKGALPPRVWGAGPTEQGGGTHSFGLSLLSVSSTSEHRAAEGTTPVTPSVPMMTPVTLGWPPPEPHPMPRAHWSAQREARSTGATAGQPRDKDIRVPTVGHLPRQRRHWLA